MSEFNHHYLVFESHISSTISTYLSFRTNLILMRSLDAINKFRIYKN